MMVLEQRLRKQRTRVRLLEVDLYPPTSPPTSPPPAPPTTPPLPEIPPLTPEEKQELESLPMPDPMEELERRLGLST